MLEKIHKCANATSRPSKKWYMETHAQKDKWVVQTKNEPKYGVHENALVAQYQRDASTIAQQANTELVHNLLGKNATISIPSNLYVWYFGAMIQDDPIGQS